MINVKKSPAADSRTAETSPTIDELRDSTISHIGDVSNGMNFIASLITERSKQHDHTKLENMEEFHAALNSGKIKDTPWYDKHITEERHHLKSHVPEDVTLIDVIEHLVDCTMAGLTRSGSIYDVDLSAELLVLACNNTVEMIKQNVNVVEDSGDILQQAIGRDFMKNH